MPGYKINYLIANIFLWTSDPFFIILPDLEPPQSASVNRVFFALV